MSSVVKSSSWRRTGRAASRSDLWRRIRGMRLEISAAAAAGLLAAFTLGTTVHGQAGWAKPAFTGQTNAPAPSKPSAPVTVQTVTNRLSGPWSVAFLPDGNFLVTEANGTMRIVRPDGVVSAALTGVPPVKSVAAQGLHDLLLDPDFARNRMLYFTYFAPPKGEAPAVWPIEFFYERVWTKPLAERRTMQIGMETVARARLSDDQRSLEHVETLTEGAERRIVLARDGTLLITGADRFRFYDSDLDGVDHDFTDNPATGELWVTDHGPQGGDEINIIRPGHDYGWPDVSYGRQYDARQLDGRKNVQVGNGKSSMSGVDEPIYYWDPDIGPSGMMFYTGSLFPEWKGDLFVGAMPSQYLSHMVVKGDRIVSEEKLLTDLKQRIRDVRQSPDGSIYVLAGNALLRLTPKK